MTRAASPAEPPHDHNAIRDGKLLRTLAVLDQLHERGDADLLIAPWRGRLAELRPTRPLNLLRLLCDPLEPLIVPANMWRNGSPGIPRTVLVSIGRMVREGFADAVAGLDAACAGHSSDEAPLVASLGARVWPRAGEILATAEIPDDWTDTTGLGEADHAILTRSIAAALSQAPSLLQLAARAWAGVEPETAELQAPLAAVAPAGPIAITMVVVMLMASLPRSQLLIGLADRWAARQDSSAGRAVADNAIEFALDTLEDAPLRGASLAQATRHLRRVAVMLIDLESHGAYRPVRRARIDRIRRKLDLACRKRLAHEFDIQLITPALAGDVEIEMLEAAAQALRRFTATASQLGEPGHYDKQVFHAAEALRPAPAIDATTREHRIRLLEILLGPDAVPAFLKLKHRKVRVA